jgi:hypothetical protein
MGLIHKGIPQEKVLDRFGDYNIFIETGTHVAKSAIWAADWFKQVYTIESVNHYYLRSQQNIIQSGKRNIELFYGRSQDILPNIVNALNEPAVIWLDAHWSRDLEGQKPSIVCPVIEELKIISNSNHIILIDDARLFGSNGWPSLDHVMQYLPKTSYVEDDVIWSE